MQKKRTDAAPVALITGAARRIGAEIARTLHSAGMNVVLHYYTSHEEAEQLSKELNAQREFSAVALKADLSAINGLEEFIGQAVGVWGRLNVVVNNASRFYRTPLGKVSEAAWNDLFDSNLKGPFFLSQAAAPFLSKEHGIIINVIDVHGERPMRDYSAYCISKAGLVMMTKSLAKDLGPAVRVNAVSPGPIIEPEGENKMTEEVKQKVIARTVLKSGGNPREVAEAVLFFASHAKYITGQILAVDGGRSLMI